MALIRFDEPHRKVHLDDLPTDPPDKVSKDEANRRMEEMAPELFELQELLWGARTNGILVVLQGRDAAGKDGVIKNVVGMLNPRGVSVTSFGVPTQEEREHDFLWRVHRHAPRAGEFSIFNRSHYEDVLVTRVHNLVPKSVWKARYVHINDFEKLLAESGTIILKYFLHISKKEQEKRLLEREKDPSKAWKLNVNDWKERELWEEFSKANEDAIEHCSSSHAPWHIVPADSKWYRNLVVAESILEAMKPYRSKWIETLEDRGQTGRHALLTWRNNKPHR